MADLGIDIDNELVITNPNATEINETELDSSNFTENTKEAMPDIIKPNQSTLPPVPIFVQVSMIIFGLVSFLSYNLFFNNTIYFGLKFAALEHISTKFLFYFNFATLPTTIVILVGSMFLIKLVRLETIVWVSYIAQFGLYVLTTILAKVDTDGYEMAFFITTLLSLVGMSAGSVLATTALIALCSMMSPILVKRYFIGQSLSAITAVFLNIMFTALPNFDGLKAGFYCFASGILSMVIVLVLFHIFLKDSYVCFYMKKSLNLTADNENLDEGEKKARVMELLPKAAKLASVTFLSCFLSVCIHPALMSLLKQSDDVVSDEFFLLLYLFLVFAVGDFLGTTCSQFVRFPGKDIILYFAVARVVLVILLIMCNITPRTIPVWFKADWWPAFFLFIFSFSYGHIISLSYSYAPSVVENAVDKAVVGTIHHCATFLGLLAGTIVSYILQILINI